MKTFFKKNRFLIFSITCLLIFPRLVSAANLHAIVVGDTLDSSIGTSVVKDINQVSDSLRDIAENSGLSLKYTVLKGKNCSRSKVMSTVKNLKPGKDDMVFFYYSGHGYRVKKMKNKWPALYLHGDSGSRKGLTEFWIFKTLKAKKPRFLMVISDSCNNLISGVDTVRSITKRASAANYKKLFVKFRGEIIASGSVPGEYSYGNSDKGGMYTHTLLTVLKNSLGSKNPNWKDIMDESIRPINIQQDKYQNPQYEMKTASNPNVINDDPNKPDPNKIDPNPTAGDTKKIKSRGLIITVLNTKKSIDKYKKFRITVKNTTKGPLSFEGKILLYGQSAATVANPSTAFVGSGIVFVQVKPGATKKTFTYCEGGNFTKWKFQMGHVYDFIVSSDKEDKELEDMMKELEDMEKELEKY